MLESHSSYSLLAIPTLSQALGNFTERSMQILGLLQIKLQQGTIDNEMLAWEPGHTDNNYVVFPAGVRFFSVIIVWLLHSDFFFLLLYIIFIKSLSHSEHMLYTPVKLPHSLHLLFFSHNHQVVFIK